MSRQDDLWSLFGSTLSSSTETSIAHDWFNSLRDGAHEWDEEVQVPAARVVGKGGGLALPLEEEDTAVAPSLERDSPATGGGSGPPPRDRGPGVQFTGPGAVFQAYLTAAASDLRDARRGVRRRIDRVFWACLGFGVAGGIAVFVGIGFLIAEAVAPGVPSTIGGAVSGFVSGIFYRLYDTENGDLKTYFSDLRVVERARLGLMLANQISDAEARNNAIRGIVQDLQVTTPEDQNPGD